MKSLITLALLSVPCIAYCQNKEVIIHHSNSDIHISPSDYPASTNHKITLTGDVVLQVSDTKITCDSAVMDNNKLYAYGNVLSASPHVSLETSELVLELADTKNVIFKSGKAKKME